LEKFELVSKKQGLLEEPLAFETSPERLVDISKIMKRKTALAILKRSIDNQSVLPQKELLTKLNVSESVLSKYIKKMKKVGLIDSEKSGRERRVNVLNLGKNLVNSVHSKGLKDFFSIASDLNRILVLESIYKNNGESTCKNISKEVNSYLGRNGKPMMDKDLLRYHLKELRRKDQITNHNRTYELTSEGGRTIKTILKILKTNIGEEKIK